MEIPKFETKGELFTWLKENKDRVLTAKKSELQKSEPFTYSPEITIDGHVTKANKPVTQDVSELKVKVVINTTNLMDHHDDVHFPGLWTKSLKENRNVMHLQEHVMQFDHIISDGEDLKAYSQTFTWKELGFKYSGQTEALVFESTVKKERNSGMFKEYKGGKEKNHSVGMMYVKIQLAVNDKDDPYWEDEYKTWLKYADQIVNKEQAEAKGYFFAVTEAKVIEGSAVPLGSNWATPTLENNMEPEKSTPTEPPQGTQLIHVIKNFKLF